MNNFAKKPTFVSISTMVLSLLTVGAQALPVSNGSFETTIGRPTNYDYFPAPFNPISPGMLRTSANITGPATTLLTLPDWQTTQDGIGCVVFPGTELTQVCGPDRFSGNEFWASPGLSPDGGNYILIDGDRDVPVSTTLYQTLTGLIVGQWYDVIFYQAAAQFTDRVGDTTEQWDVSLGGDPLNHTHDGNIIGGTHQLSDLMHTPSQGFHAWQKQTLRFQVTDPSLSHGSVTSQVLGFFSVGTPGGLPPVVLLDGVSISAVPEPPSYTLLSIGILGVLFARAYWKKPV